MNRWKPLVGAALGAVLASPEQFGRAQAAELVKSARMVKQSGAKAE